MSKVSISQAWDEARAVLARDGKLISTVALALLVLPGLILNLLLPRGADVTTSQQLVWIVAGIIGLLVTFTGQLSVIRLAMGPHISVGEAIRHAASRVLPFFGAFLLWMMPLLILGSYPYNLIRSNPAAPQTTAGVALLVVMIVGMIVGVRLMVIGPVAAAESGGPLRMISRSWEITRGNWWRLFGFLVVFAVGAVALIWAFNTVLSLVARLTIGPVSPVSVAGLVMILLSQILTAAIYVLLFVMQTRIYLQLSGAEAPAEARR